MPLPIRRKVWLSGTSWSISARFMNGTMLVQVQPLRAATSQNRLAEKRGWTTQAAPAHSEASTE